jgi:hypothetical protein
MAKVKIEPGKTMASPKALATQLLGGKSSADPALVKDLATKIREKNDLVKGQDLTSNMVLKVGKVTTKKFGTLVDPSDTNKYSFASPLPSSQGQSFTVSPTPSIPAPEPAKKQLSTKSATPDVVLIDQESLPVDLMLSLTLEKIGGQELISIARHDTVNGQNILYQPIKNVSDVAISYNPQNMISFPDNSENYFKNFVIKLESHIPQTTNTSPANNVYLDPDTGNIVIENTALKRDYDIEVEMLSSGKIFNDTIYDEDSL